MQRITFGSETATGSTSSSAGARGEIDRLQARLAEDRDARAFERRLSGAGALALLGLSLVGPAGVALLALAAGLVAAIATAIVERRGRAIVSDDRWQLWRSVEPDPEYLRSGA